MTDTPHVVTIGVAGGTASGKSTISRAILDQVGSDMIAHLLHDSYYKELAAFGPDTRPEDINFDHPNSLDTPLLVEHLRLLQQGQPIEMPVYDFVTYERTAVRHVEPRPVVLVEGILVLAEKELRDLFDIKIFVDTADDLRLIRRIQRDVNERGRSVESVIHQYLSTVRPMHLAFVQPSMRHADVIVPQGGHNAVAIDMIADRIRGIVSGNFAMPTK